MLAPLFCLPPGEKLIRRLTMVRSAAPKDRPRARVLLEPDASNSIPRGVTGADRGIDAAISSSMLAYAMSSSVSESLSLYDCERAILAGVAFRIACRANEAGGCQPGGQPGGVYASRGVGMCTVAGDLMGSLALNLGAGGGVNKPPTAAPVSLGRSGTLLVIRSPRVLSADMAGDAGEIGEPRPGDCSTLICSELMLLPRVETSTQELLFIVRVGTSSSSSSPLTAAIIAQMQTMSELAMPAASRTSNA